MFPLSFRSMQKVYGWPAGLSVLLRSCEPSFPHFLHSADLGTRTRRFSNIRLKCCLDCARVQDTPSCIHVIGCEVTPALLKDRGARADVFSLEHREPETWGVQVRTALQMYVRLEACRAAIRLHRRNSKPCRTATPGRDAERGNDGSTQNQSVE